MRGFVLLLAAASAVVHAQDTGKAERSLVRIAITDKAMHRALELKANNAPEKELQRIKIHQPYQLLLSGVTISRTGEIVTMALHPRADLRVEVTFHDGKKELAKVVGTDPWSNLALLRVTRETGDFLALDETEIKAGQPVDVCGHASVGPLFTVHGNVAQQRMTVSIRDLYCVNQGKAIHPGSVFVVATPVARANPGSACIDTAGRLVGIAIGRLPPRVALQSEEGRTKLATYEVTFVLPARRVARIVSDLRKHGRVIRAYYGFDVVAAHEALRAHFSLPACASNVLKVEPGSPASKAGLRRNDVLLGIDGDRFRDMAELGEVMRDKAPGNEVRLDVLREGKEIALPTTPIERPH